MLFIATRGFERGLLETCCLNTTQQLKRIYVRVIIRLIMRIGIGKWRGVERENRRRNKSGRKSEASLGGTAGGTPRILDRKSVDKRVRGQPIIQA